MTQHLDEGTVHAWLDGAIATEESDVIAAHIAQCGQCGAAVAEARGLMAASSRILSALDDVPGNAIPSSTVPPRERWSDMRAKRNRRNIYLRAAGILMVVGLGATVIRQQKSSTFREKQAADAALSLQAPDSSAKKREGPIAAPTPIAVAERTSVNQSGPPPERRFESVGKAKGSTGSLASAAAVKKSESTAGVVAVKDQSDAMLVVLQNDSGLVAKGDTAVYEVRPGVTVTLAVDSVTIDVRSLEDRAVVSERRQAKAVMSKQMMDKRAAASAAPPAAPPPPSVLLPMNTIRWFDAATRRWLSLRGRLTVAQLDSLKAVLPQLRRVGVK
jgi:hypothetical protein